MAAPQVQVEQAPMMAAQPTTYALPAVSYDQPPQVSYATTAQSYAAPTQYAAPLQHFSAAPITAPLQQFSTAPMTAASYAGPPQVAQVQHQQPGQSLFDMMDRNHDGVITRQEFNQALVR